MTAEQEINRLLATDPLAPAVLALAFKEVVTANRDEIMLEWDMRNALIIPSENSV